MAVSGREASLSIPGSADLLGFSCIRVVRVSGDCVEENGSQAPDGHMLVSLVSL